MPGAAASFELNTLPRSCVSTVEQYHRGRYKTHQHSCRGQAEGEHAQPCLIASSVLGAKIDTALASSDAALIHDP